MCPTLLWKLGIFLLNLSQVIAVLYPDGKLSVTAIFQSPKLGIECETHLKDTATSGEISTGVYYYFLALATWDASYPTGKNFCMTNSIPMVIAVDSANFNLVHWKAAFDSYYYESIRAIRTPSKVVRWTAAQDPNLRSNEHVYVFLQPRYSGQSPVIIRLNQADGHYVDKNTIYENLPSLQYGKQAISLFEYNSNVRAILLQSKIDFHSADAKYGLYQYNFNSGAYTKKSSYFPTASMSSMGFTSVTLTVDGFIFLGGAVSRESKFKPYLLTLSENTLEPVAQHHLLDGFGFYATIDILVSANDDSNPFVYGWIAQRESDYSFSSTTEFGYFMMAHMNNVVASSTNCDDDGRNYKVSVHKLKINGDAAVYVPLEMQYKMDENGKRYLEMIMLANPSSSDDTVIDDTTKIIAIQSSGLITQKNYQCSFKTLYSDIFMDQVYEIEPPDCSTSNYCKMAKEYVLDPVGVSTASFNLEIGFTWRLDISSGTHQGLTHKRPALVRWCGSGCTHSYYEVSSLYSSYDIAFMRAKNIGSVSTLANNAEDTASGTSTMPALTRPCSVKLSEAEFTNYFSSLIDLDVSLASNAASPYQISIPIIDPAGSECQGVRTFYDSLTMPAGVTQTWELPATSYTAADLTSFGVSMTSGFRYYKWTITAPPGDYSFSGQDAYYEDGALESDNAISFSLRVIDCSLATLAIDLTPGVPSEMKVQETGTSDLIVSLTLDTTFTRSATGASNCKTSLTQLSYNSDCSDPFTTSDTLSIAASDHPDDNNKYLKVRAPTNFDKNVYVKAESEAQGKSACSATAYRVYTIKCEVGLSDTNEWSFSLLTGSSSRHELYDFSSITTTTDTTGVMNPNLCNAFYKAYNDEVEVTDETTWFFDGSSNPILYVNPQYHTAQTRFYVRVYNWDQSSYDSKTIIYATCNEQLVPLDYAEGEAAFHLPLRTGEHTFEFTHVDDHLQNRAEGCYVVMTRLHTAGGFKDKMYVGSQNETTDPFFYLLDTWGESKFQINSDHASFIANANEERNAIVTALLRAGGQDHEFKMPLHLFCWNQVLSIAWNAGVSLGQTYAIASTDYMKTISLSDLWTVSTDLLDCYEEEINIYLEPEKTTFANTSDVLTFNHNFNGTGGQTTVEVTIDIRYSRVLNLYVEMKQLTTPATVDLSTPYVFKVCGEKAQPKPAYEDGYEIKKLAMEGAPNICTLLNTADLDAMMEIGSQCDSIQATGTLSMDETTSYEVDSSGAATSTPYAPSLDVDGSSLALVYREPGMTNQECITFDGLKLASHHQITLAKKFTSDTGVVTHLKVIINFCKWTFTAKPYTNSLSDVLSDPDQFLRITPSDLLEATTSCEGIVPVLKFDQPQSKMYYAQSDQQLLVDTSIVYGKILKFTIRVFAETQISGYPELAFEQDVDVEVSICVDQAPLSRLTQKEYIFLEQKTPTLAYFYNFSAPELFIDIDESCTVFKYEVTSDSRGTPGPTSTGSPIFYIDEANNTLVLNTTLAYMGKHKFYIHAYSVSGKTTEAYKSIQVEIEIDTNQAPEFEAKLPTFLQVDVKEKDQISSSIEPFSYESPLLVDREGNKPVMTVRLPIEHKTALEKFLKIYVDLSAMAVVVDVDTMRVQAENAGMYDVILIIADDGPTPRYDNYYTFKLIITYEEVPKEEEEPPAEGEGEEEGEEGGDEEASEEGEASDPEEEEPSESTDSTTEDPEEGGNKEGQAGELEEREGNSGGPFIDPTEEEEDREEEETEDEQKAVINAVAEEEAKQEAQTIEKKTFPGIDPAQLQYLIDRLKRKNQIIMEREAGLTEEVVEVEEAKIKFEPARSDGLIEMTFSQKLLAPSDISKVDYSSVFEIYLISAIDGAKVYPQVQTSTKFAGSGEAQGRRLAIYDTSASQDEETTFEINFEFEVVEHSESRLALKLEFDDPDSISSTVYGRDKLVVKMIDLKPFISAETGQSLDPKSFPGGLPMLTKELPPIQDPTRSAQMANSTEKVGVMVNTIGTGNFFLALILNGSMQQLFGMIRAIQVIVLTSLMNLVFPSNAAAFYQGAIMFASMDILSGEALYEKIFVFKETPPLSTKFEELDYGDMNYIMNSGSILIMLLIILAEPLVCRGINFLCLQIPNSGLSRRIGLRIYRDHPRKALKDALLRLFMESYFELAMCTFLNIMAFSRAKNLGEFLDFLATPDDAFCTTLTLLTFVMLMVFPCWIFFKIKSNFSKLDDPATIDSFGIIYSEFDTSRLSSSLFQFFFLLRRFLMVLTLVLLRTQTFYQAQLLLVYSWVNFIYLSYNYPFRLMSQNYIEVMNEFCIFLSSHIINSFLNAGVSTHFRSTMGWTLIGIAGLNICLNLVIVGYLSVRDVMNQGFSHYSSQMAHRQSMTNLQNREYFARLFPNQMAHFAKIRKEYEARLFCREWHPQRMWLMKNGIDFSEFPDEIKFQRLVEEFDFEAKAKAIKMFKVQCLMAQKLEKKKNTKMIESKVKKDILGTELSRILTNAPARKSRNAMLDKKSRSTKSRQGTNLSAIKLLDTIREDDGHSSDEEHSPKHSLRRKKSLIQAKLKERFHLQAVEAAASNSESPSSPSKSPPPRDQTEASESPLPPDSATQPVSSMNCSITPASSKSIEVKSKKKPAAPSTTLQEEFEQLQVKDMFKMNQSRNLSSGSNILNPVHSFINPQFLEGLIARFQNRNRPMPAELKLALEQELAYQKKEGTGGADQIEFLEEDEGDDPETIAEELIRVLEMNDEALCELATQYDQLPLLKDGGPNNFLGSALYLIFEVPPVVGYLVSHCKQDQLDSCDKDKLRRTLCQVFRQAFIFNQFKSVVSKPEVSLAKVSECLEQAFDPEYCYRAKSALNTLIGTILMKIKKESSEQQEQLQTDSPNSSLGISPKLFSTSFAVERHCLEGGCLKKSANEQWILELVPTSPSLQECLMTQFAEKKVCFYCKSCKVEAKGVQYSKFTRTPPFLFIHLKRHRKDGKAKERKEVTFPLRFDAASTFEMKRTEEGEQVREEEDRDIKALVEHISHEREVYSLYGVVAHDGEELDSSSYFTFLKRSSGWMKYEASTISEASDEDLLGLFCDAELLLYKKEIVTTEDRFEEFERARLEAHRTAGPATAEPPADLKEGLGASISSIGSHDGADSSSSSEQTDGIVEEAIGGFVQQ